MACSLHPCNSLPPAPLLHCLARLSCCRRHDCLPGVGCRAGAQHPCDCRGPDAGGAFPPAQLPHRPRRAGAWEEDGLGSAVDVGCVLRGSGTYAPALLRWVALLACGVRYACSAADAAAAGWQLWRWALRSAVLFGQSIYFFLALRCLGPSQAALLPCCRCRRCPTDWRRCALGWPPPAPSPSSSTPRSCWPRTRRATSARERSSLV